MECLDNIIGITRTECECFAPIPTPESLSGIYLDELDGFNLKVAQGADDCAKGGLFDRMQKSIDNAKVDLTKDLLGCISQQYKPRAELFNGQLGQPGYKSTLNLTTNYAGIKIFPLQVKGAYLYLKRVGIIINAAVNVTVKVYKKLSDVEEAEEISSYTTGAPVTANTLTWLVITPTPLELPMWSYGGRVDYFVVLELDGTFQPKNNLKDCNCGGATKPYLKWLDFNGTKGNDFNFSSQFTQTTELNGVVLDVEIKCKTASLICDAERTMDFENNSFDQYLAYAIRFKAAEKMFRDLISTDQINRQTMMNREYVEGMIKEWGMNYMECINYLCSTVNVDNNDCLICRDQRNILKGKIKV